MRFAQKPSIGRSVLGVSPSGQVTSGIDLGMHLSRIETWLGFLKQRQGGKQCVGLGPSFF